MQETSDALDNTDLRARLRQLIYGRHMQLFITILIVLNAAILGLQTSETLTRLAGGLMEAGNMVILAAFVLEILLKLLADGPRFFRSGWNLFDFLIVGISLVPGTGSLSILRALRILRVLRLLSTIERLRHIIESLLRAIPSIGWIAFLLLMVFYIFGVMGTELFGERFPDWFGTVGLTMFTLFQIMTLESWSMGIARPVMEAFPYAWIYFVSFILVSSFTILNIFIGIIVNTMHALEVEAEHERAAETESRAHRERQELLREIRGLGERLARLERDR